VLHNSGGARSQGWLFRAALAICVFCLLIALPAAAFAYVLHTDGRETPPTGPPNYACEDCHVTFPGGSEVANQERAGFGPHGYYRSTTDKCRMCHTVHGAPANSKKLLPAETIDGACFTCHDNTGAAGVYSGIAARGGKVEASHSINTTVVVPGGTYDLMAELSCPSCHSVHRATTVEAFRTDQDLPMGDGAKYSNALLRDDVGGAARNTYTKYGAQWCAGCHDKRDRDMAVGHVVNHPTEQLADGFNYGRVASVKSETSLDTWILEDETLTPGNGLGGENFGYVMPWPRTPEQDGHNPICQQCHEDARNVGVPGAAVAFSSTTTTNPLYYSFPHQSTNPNFVIEKDDDLCLNCHTPEQLP
jgi:predicted CXXCH cytochrome family protein